MDRDRYLVRRPAPAGPSTWQLVCFPHAGGGAAAYAAWASELAPSIDVIAVCPTGRERQLTLRPHDTMPALVDDLATVLAPVLRPPFAFFGHSLGALVAFELARCLSRAGHGPAHLFASASRPPHVPGTAGRLLPLDDGALIADLARYGGIPSGLAEEPELLSLVLPALRADLLIAAEYLAPSTRALACPITAIGGDDDPGVDLPTVAGWREHTTGPFRLEVLAGGHFYLVPSRHLVLDLIRRDLSGTPTVLPRPTRGVGVTAMEEVARDPKEDGIHVRR